MSPGHRVVYRVARPRFDDRARIGVKTKCFVITLQGSKREKEREKRRKRRPSDDGDHGLKNCRQAEQHEAGGNGHFASSSLVGHLVRSFVVSLVSALNRVAE